VLDRSQDFTRYRQLACRFPNEGGVLGPCSLPTIEESLGAGERRIGSFAWQVHDNGNGSNAPDPLPDNMLRHFLGMEASTLSLAEYAYWGGLIMGEGLAEYCDNFRRRMFDSASAIFWMFNDCWPAVRSWTIVDHPLRRTPAFYPVKRAFSPIHVVVTREAGQIEIYGINDTREQVEAELRFGIFHLAGGYPLERTVPVVLPENTATRLMTFAPSADFDPRTSIPFAQLGQGQALLARNRLVEVPFKDLRWPRAEVELTVEDGQAVFTSATFVWGVCLDLDGAEALPDNFFDLYPGIPFCLPWSRPTLPSLVHIGNLASPTAV